MPQAYSNDLRRKLLQAYDEGEGTLEELLGLPLKKKHSTPRSKTVKKRSAAAKPGEKP